MEHVVIIGNGISGVTAARHIRKYSDKQISIISPESTYFFSRTALMYIYMGHMKFEHTQPYENDFWKTNNIDLIQERVTKVHVDKKMVDLSNNESISYTSLIIATGSKPNKFGWPGQDLDRVSGLYSKQDLDQIETWSADCQRAVIVGGGLIGIELAEMFLSRNIAVTFLVRESSFWSNVLPPGESELINRHIIEHGIDLRLGTNLTEIISDAEGKAKAIKTDKDEIIPCQIVGLTAGVSPNIDFIKESGIEINRGVKVNSFLRTNAPDVYAIGDCAEQHEAIGSRRPIEAVWYTGRMMGETVAQTICGMETAYQPGNWFNSAKFLDIEYQTYGWVWAEPKEGESHFYWEHPEGKMCVRLAYESSTRKFLGINTFGIRMKHEFFDRVLNENRSVDFVTTNLKFANFDPEFYSHYEQDILSAFNSNKQ